MKRISQAHNGGGYPFLTRLAAVCALLLLVPFAVLAKEKRSKSADFPTEDHLIQATDFATYGREFDRILQKQVLVSPANCGRMIVLPMAAEGEYAVSVYGQGSRGSAREYHVSYTKAERSIAQEYPTYASERSRKSIRVLRLDVPIRESVALAVCRTWKEMLSLVKTGDPAYEELVENGQVVEFSIIDGAAVNLRGELPFRGGKRPTALRKIGDMLIDYCKAKPELRPEIANRIEIEANTLVADIKAEEKQK